MSQVAKAKPEGDVRSLMISQKDQIAKALPSHMKPERMLRIALTELSKNPELMQCDKVSFLGAIIQCAQLGLEPGSGLGHAYLIPFKNRKKGITECQFIPGYKGLIDLARRSGNIESISSHIVHKKDVFRVAYGDDAKITHEPYVPDWDPEKEDEPDDAGPIVACYAVARFKGGGIQREVMYRSDLERHKSQYGKSNPVWETHFDEMCRKTLVRRIAKYLPLSPELREAFEKDDQAQTGESQENWLAADPAYLPAPQTVDMEKFREATGQAADDRDYDAAADLDLAIEEGKACGVFWASVLNRSYDDVVAKGATSMRAAAEIIRAKVKAKGGQS